MLVIEKEKMNEWVKELAKKTPVFASMRRLEHGVEESVFEKFNPTTDLESTERSVLDFDYLPTLRSIKEFFLPEKEDIFVFEKGKNKISSATRPRPFIIFGLNSRDLEALIQLDEIMAKPNEDFFYLQKRNNATIIGLIKINETQYEVEILNDKNKLAKTKFLKETAETSKTAGNSEIMPRLRQLLLDPELLSDAVSWSWKNDPAVWDELAGLCLGCGICAYVCPLCYCFSIEDSINLGGKKGSRCRQWDACTLPKFAQISGALPDGRQGFNFHKTIKERYYNWYFHKFVRAYREYGKSQCVACGRCQKYCPAKIDIEKYLVKIIDDYKKSLNIT